MRSERDVDTSFLNPTFSSFSSLFLLGEYQFVKASKETERECEAELEQRKNFNLFLLFRFFFLISCSTAPSLSFSFLHLRPDALSRRDSSPSLLRALRSVEPCSSRL